MVETEAVSTKYTLRWKQMSRKQCSKASQFLQDIHNSDMQDATEEGLVHVVTDVVQNLRLQSQQNT